MWWTQENSGSQQDDATRCSDRDMRKILQSVLFVDTLKYHVINAEDRTSEDDIYIVVSPYKLMHT